MKKVLVLWLLTTFVLLNLSVYDEAGLGYYETSHVGAWVVAAIIVSGIFGITRRSRLVSGRLLPTSDNKLRLNGLQRVIALSVAGLITLVQAYQLGNNGFDGIGWILGLAFATGLFLIAFHGLEFKTDEKLSNIPEIKAIESKTVVDKMRYIYAFAAATVLVALYAFLIAIFDWKHGGGALVKVLFISALVGTWAAIMNKKNRL